MSATLERNILQAISDFDGVREAITKNGVEVPHGTDTKEYRELVNAACKTQYKEGKAAGQTAGYETGYEEGHTAGYEEGKAIADKFPYLNTATVGSWAYFFYANSRTDLLKKIDTSNGVQFANFMYGATYITEIPSNINFDKGMEFTAAFRGSGITKLPNINAKIIGASNMCYGCTSLTTVVGLDLSGGGTMANAFNGCTKLTYIHKLVLPPSTNLCTNMFNNCSKLMRVIAEGKIKVNTNTFKINYSNDLTVESMMSFINAFEDNTGGTTYTVYFGTTNIKKLSAEQRQIAADKNINLG